MLHTFNSLIQFATMAHPYVQALLVLAAALVIGLVILPVVAGVIRYFTSKTKSDIDDRLIAAVTTPVLYLIVLIGVVIALPLLTLPLGIAAVLMSFVKTLFIVVVAQGVTRTLTIILEGAAKAHRLAAVNNQTLPLFSNVLLLLVISGALYGVFLVWGIDVTAWLASAGIIGIAVGFAAKDTLANLISGVFILADAPYKIGDFVVLDSGERGQVTQVGLRSTRLLTRSDTEITIPNSVMGGSKIVNETGGPHKKFRVTALVGVAYDSDVEKVEALLYDIAAQEELLCSDPEPVVRFTAFGESSLDFNLNFWVEEPKLRGKALHFVNTAIFKRFSEENIEIPFPQRDVNMKK